MSKKNININIPVSPGELVDKITILEIKSRRVKDKQKLASVKKELNLLKGSITRLMGGHKKGAAKFKTLKLKLYKINLTLWKIEDEIRKLELKKDFGIKFIKLARSVYITNDSRSAAKIEINMHFGSQLNEVKQYVKYTKKS